MAAPTPGTSASGGGGGGPPAAAAVGEALRQRRSLECLSDLRALRHRKVVSASLSSGAAQRALRSVCERALALSALDAGARALEALAGQRQREVDALRARAPVSGGAVRRFARSLEGHAQRSPAALGPPDDVRSLRARRRVSGLAASVRASFEEAVRRAAERSQGVRIGSNGATTAIDDGPAASAREEALAASAARDEEVDAGPADTADEASDSPSTGAPPDGAPSVADVTASASVDDVEGPRARVRRARLRAPSAASPAVNGVEELHSLRLVSSMLRSAFASELDSLVRGMFAEHPPGEEHAFGVRQRQPAGWFARNANRAAGGRRARMGVLADAGSQTPHTRQREQRGAFRANTEEAELRTAEDERLVSVSDLARTVAELGATVRLQMDMTLEMRRMLSQEVAAALARTNGEAEVASSSPPALRRWELVRAGTCAVCCAAPIDCLLYRCGHMCTCTGCATQIMARGRLQRGGPRCPMCRAPVLDVVRAYGAPLAEEPDAAPSAA